MNNIALLAKDILDDNEMELAMHLKSVLDDSTLDAASLILEIVPVFSDSSGTRTLEPDPIYRPLMYLEMYANGRDFRRVTRIFILNACWHIEGCLKWLMPHLSESGAVQGPFGPLVLALIKGGIVPFELGEQLMNFNKAAYVPAHHPSARYTAGSSLNESTFSVLEASLVFVMMRKSSMRLFDLMEARGVILPHGWKEHCWFQSSGC